jgi:hypothetical protein
MHYGVPENFFFVAFDRLNVEPGPGNSYGTRSRDVRVQRRRPEVDRFSTSGGATIAVWDFEGPVSPEPLESERSYWVETRVPTARVRRSNLPVVTTSGSDFRPVKVFAPKFSATATAESGDDMELFFGDSCASWLGPSFGGV